MMANCYMNSALTIICTVHGKYLTGKILVDRTGKDIWYVNKLQSVYMPNTFLVYVWEKFWQIAHDSPFSPCQISPTYSTLQLQSYIMNIILPNTTAYQREVELEQGASPYPLDDPYRVHHVQMLTIHDYQNDNPVCEYI